ncbi:MAG TPA: phenylalanine--tRNA ligase subunit beta [Verrucomicrobiae bacterium]|nr:phenylalanine--tRNA ligase subunit beta [Verrucomicrobiae bacterium]
MKVTLNWLKQYVDFDWSPEVLSERLTMLGIEVEGMSKIGGEFEGIVVAQVITRDKHPNADKLSLCRVNDGKGERQIVCGAQNFKAGDKVALILPGASLPARPGAEPFTIKVGRIRGVESQGMMCSPQELGLPDHVDGLLILREDAIPGQPFAEYLGRSGADVVYDLEITPNRPDLNSVIGIAREIAAVTGNPLRLPEVTTPDDKTSGRAVADLVSVRIEDVELCPRYTARLVEGVKIAPAPDWMRSLLEKVGVRSINNVVDVTNYVMLESGQPLHAFDYHLLKAAEGKSHPTIVVRRAREGERFITLDGQERALSPQMLLIADESRPVALGGVMGGQNSEINLNTVDVLIESAYFNPSNIRATSKKLDLRTESSYRFERGADIGLCEWASRRAAQLILQTAGGTLAAGVVDAYPQPAEPRQITLRPTKVKDLLGIELSSDQIEEYLSRLEIKAASRKPRPVGAESPASEPGTFRVPSFRVDLKREVDLIEEVARLYGVDRIPSTEPRGAIGANPFDSVHDQYAQVRANLVGLGLFEAQGQTLISDAAASLLSNQGPVLLGNPLSSDMNVLRPSLLPGLLDSLRHNVSRKNYDVGLFELGRVFNHVKGGETAASPTGSSLVTAVTEQRNLAIALTGQRAPVFWAGPERDAKFDIYDLKGMLEEFLEQFGVRGVVFAAASQPDSFFLESGVLQLGKFELGHFGQLSPLIAKRYDLRDAVFLAELNLDTLMARRNVTKSFRALAAFPPIRRDIAMLLPEGTTHEAVLQTIKQAKPANLESVELFDVFRGKNVAAGLKSMAYAFTYRSPERTLTDAEVNTAHEKVVEQLKQKLNAVVRDS